MPTDADADADAGEDDAGHPAGGGERCGVMAFVRRSSTPWNSERNSPLTPGSRPDSLDLGAELASKRLESILQERRLQRGEPRLHRRMSGEDVRGASQHDEAAAGHCRERRLYYTCYRCAADAFAAVRPPTVGTYSSRTVDDAWR